MVVSIYWNNVCRNVGCCGCCKELVLAAVLQVAKQLVSGFESGRAVCTGAFVDHGEVDVAGNELSEMLKKLLPEHFRHNISALICGGDSNKLNEAVLDMFAEEMVADIDVLGALLGCRVVGDLQCSAVVFIHYTRLADFNPHCLKEHIDPNKFSDSKTKRHVLGFTGAGSHAWEWFVVHWCSFAWDTRIFVRDAVIMIGLFRAAL